MRRRPLLIAVSAVAVLHVFIAVSLVPALGMGAMVSGLVLALLFASALLTPAPILVRLAALSEKQAEVIAWSGYLAMGLFSTLFVLTLLRDLVLFSYMLMLRFFSLGADPSQISEVSARGVLALSLIVTLSGIVGARRLARVVHVDLPVARLPEALVGFRIVQLSDVHIGPTINRGYVSAIVERVNTLNADVVALTGDIIDGDVARLRQHAQPLSRLQARYGTYCVTGNHEYYHGADAWIDEFRSLGLRVLMNENVIIDHRGERLLLAGITDFSASHMSGVHRSDPSLAIESDVPVSARILLAHQPRSMTAAADAGFDIQLSGHTHGGQFLPWMLFVPLQQPFVAGLKRFRNLQVYVSRGTGYWGPPIRFGAPSEITVLRLVPAPADLPPD